MTIQTHNSYILEGSTAIHGRTINSVYKYTLLQLDAVTTARHYNLTPLELDAATTGRRYKWTPLQLDAVTTKRCYNWTPLPLGAVTSGPVIHRAILLI